MHSTFHAIPAVAPKFDQISAKLKAIPNWVLYKLEEPKRVGGKPIKVPYRPNGQRAKVNDSGTWSSFARVEFAYRAGGFAGIGFVFDGKPDANGHVLTGIDLDNCVDPLKTPKISPIASERVKQFAGAYIEYSQSGTGLHAIGRADPSIECIKTNSGEVYNTTRFFVVTGHGKGDPDKVITDAVRSLVAELKAEKSGAAGPNFGSDDDTSQSFAQGPGSNGAAGDASMSTGINTSWYDTLPGDVKDEVIENDLLLVASHLKYLDLTCNGGNNSEYHKVTLAAARSGAPNAEGIFVHIARRAQDADSDEELHRHFQRCRDTPAPKYAGVTVGYLLGLAKGLGEDHTKYKNIADQIAVGATVGNGSGGGGGLPPGSLGLSGSFGSSGASLPTSETVIYVPENAEVCRAAITRLVRSQDDFFTLGQRAGDLVRLCIPDEDDKQLVSRGIAWGGDQAATLHVTAADLVKRCDRGDRLIWKDRGQGRPRTAKP
jgi:hypothetical protein